jgi:predicted  nucleic acid-binding Zn-ribbon protein
MSTPSATQALSASSLDQEIATLKTDLADYEDDESNIRSLEREIQSTSQAITHNLPGMLAHSPFLDPATAFEEGHQAGSTIRADVDNQLLLPLLKAKHEEKRGEVAAKRRRLAELEEEKTRRADEEKELRERRVRKGEGADPGDEDEDVTMAGTGGELSGEGQGG